MLWMWGPHYPTGTELGGWAAGGRVRSLNGGKGFSSGAEGTVLFEGQWMVADASADELEALGPFPATYS